jgi:molybdopterin-synthase adenylyltransferase
MGRVVMSEEHYSILNQHLRESRKEGFAFLLCDHSLVAPEPVMLVRDLVTVDDQETVFDGDGFSLSERALDEVINRGAAAGMALIEVHKHHLGPPAFSRTDRAGLLPFAKFVLESLPNRPYAAMVWAKDEMYGEWFILKDGTVDSGKIKSVCVIGQRLRQLIRPPSDRAPSERTKRQIPLVGEEGQRTLENLRLAIIGLGGIGSHVLQAFCYLGAKRYLLVDRDALEESNLNRVVFANSSQVGVLKVEAARRYVNANVHNAIIETVPERVQSNAQAEALLSRCDMIFGCVDDDGPRLLLNRVATSACIPYFDLATGILMEGRDPVVGGRLAVTLPGGPCLACTEELDVEEVRAYFLSDAERHEGIRRGYLQGAEEDAPSVVSLNGLIAHAAITELALFLSGTRKPSLRIDLDVIGDDTFPGPRLLPRKAVQRKPGCVECAQDQVRGAA